MGHNIYSSKDFWSHENSLGTIVIRNKNILFGNDRGDYS